MNYHLTGSKNQQTILFLHGLGADLSQFEEQQSYFESNYQVLSISLPLDKNPLSLYTIAVEIKMLLGKLDIEHVHIVGNSMGGDIGFELLKNYPSTVLSLCTFGTTPYMKSPKPFTLIMKFIIWVFPLKLIAKLASYSGVSSMAQNTIYKMFLRHSKKELYRSIDMLSNFDYGDIIETSQKPLCIIKAQKDKEINRLLEKPIKKWKNRKWFTLYKINHAGHFANLDEPLKFNKVLSKFLNTLNPTNLD